MLWLNVSKKQLFRLLLLLLGALTAVLIYNTITTTADDGPYYFSDTSEPQVAISFEVVWGEGDLKDILAILEKEKIKATFFISGAWITNFSEPAQEILLKGHEIGKYSFSSIPYTFLTEDDIAIEFENFNKLTGEVLEYRSRLFRPPLGNYNEFMIDVAKRYGYRTVLWSIDSHDLIANDSDDIINRISGRLHYGSIINFRTNSEHLIDALPVIINYIKESDYDILTVSDLIDNHNK